MTLRIFVALLWLAQPGAAQNPATPRKHDEAIQALQDIRARVATLQRELERADSQESDASESLRESDRAISDASRALAEFERAKTAIGNQLEVQQAELASLTREQGLHRQALRRLVIEQHRNREQEPLRVLVAGGSPFEVRRQLRYLQLLNAARLDAMREANRRADRLAALRNAASIQMAELERLFGEGRTTRQLLARERAQRQGRLADLATQLAARRRELDVLRGDETRVERLVERLAGLLGANPVRPRRTLPGGTAEAPAAGELTAALARFKGSLKFPAVGELVARFGVPRGGSGPASKGWFIRTSSGTPVVAVASGRVVFADWLRGFGNLLIVDHGDGFMSLYGNNDALLQQVGSVVESGATVAQAGTSGGASESGVYFELRHNGVALDPKDWFDR